MVKKATRLTAEEVSALISGDEEAPVEVRGVEFVELEASEPTGHKGSVGTPPDFVWDIPLAVEVVLGQTEMKVRDVLEVQPGAVIELDQSYGDPVEIFLNGRLAARGEVVIAGEQFGVRIREVLVSSEELADSPE